MLDALRASGLEGNTVVVFTSDHGEMDASHKLEHKSMPYEEAMRVPFIVSRKGVTPAGRVDTTASGFDRPGPDPHALRFRGHRHAPRR